MPDALRVGVVGASGYAGGELLRLLDAHPHVQLAYATSQRFAGKPLRAVHPHLRHREDTFAPHAAAEEQEVDALFYGGPHGTSAPRMRQYMKLAPRVFDLSADFRLADPALYATFYGGWEHPCPELLRDRAYGIAELHRERIRTAPLVAGAGCVATAAILALAPLARAGVLAGPAVVDAKVGSSAAGAEASAASHHPVRRDVLRTYAATGHRHTAEVREQTGLRDVGLTCTAVELVRGILATCHVWLREPLEEKAVWRLYRAAYGEEPFVRVVKERQGLYRFPEPKLLAGTNACHLGFERDPLGQRLVVLSALDNLGKGSAGAAIQNLNLAFGFPERTGLALAGLHP